MQVQTISWIQWTRTNRLGNQVPSYSFQSFSKTVSLDQEVTPDPNATEWHNVFLHRVDRDSTQQESSGQR